MILRVLGTFGPMLEPYEPAHEIMVSHRRPAKSQASLHINEDSTEPSLFAHMKYGSSQRV